jgi:hypothetical protein
MDHSVLHYNIWLRNFHGIVYPNSPPAVGFENGCFSHEEGVELW